MLNAVATGAHFMYIIQLGSSIFFMMCVDKVRLVCTYIVEGQQGFSMPLACSLREATGHIVAFTLKMLKK